MAKRDFFISYTAEDEAWARKIAQILEAYGYPVYVQYRDSPYGESIVRWMDRALGDVSDFIAVWSRAYEGSEHCAGEIETAYEMKIYQEIGRFLLFRVEDHPVRTLFRRFGRVDLFGLDDVQVEERILRAVGYEGPVRRDAGASAGSVRSVEDREAPDPTVSPTQGSPMAEFYQRGESYYLYQRGEDYYYGQHGVEQDYGKAREYWEQAAARGHADALFRLGFLYGRGYGVTQDYGKAREYYEQAAAKGDAYALNNLGVLYHEGYGVEKDYPRAHHYYLQAVEKGNALAARNLGDNYRDGIGETQDYEKALEWYQKAADLGNEDAPARIRELREKMGR